MLHKHVAAAPERWLLWTCWLHHRPVLSQSHVEECLSWLPFTSLSRTVEGLSNHNVMKRPLKKTLMVHTFTSTVKDLVAGRNRKCCVTAVSWSVDSERGEERLGLKGNRLSGRISQPMEHLAPAQMHFSVFQQQDYA